MVRRTKEIYPAWVRREMIREVYRKEVDEELVKVWIIPDIEGVAIGRDVGYYLVEVPDDIKKISGTNIRAGLNEEIPEEVQRVLNAYKHMSETTKRMMNVLNDESDD